MTRILTLLFAICALASVAGAQSYTTTSGSLTGGYTDLTSPTQVNLGYAQISSAIAPAGFSLNYFGTNYTSFKIASGGYMTMGSTGSIVAKQPSHTTAPGTVISALWTTLAPGSRLGSASAPAGTVGYTFTGGVLSVEWKNVPLNGSSSIGVRMKIVINTTTNTIEFQYGKVPSTATGATSAVADTVAISGPTGINQEIIAGPISGYVSNNGSVTTYPATQFVRFTPNGTPTNNAPGIAVTVGSATQVTSGGTVNVAYNDTVSSLATEIAVTDADSDPVSLAASITNLGSTGITISEWQSTSAATPYDVYPTNGTFNTVAGATHRVTLTADDGTDQTVFFYDIVQAPQPFVNTAPTISVSDSAGTVSNGGTINVAYNDTVSSLALDIDVDDFDAHTTSLAATITNQGATGISIAEWQSASAAVPYMLGPTTGTFNTAAGVTHTVTLTADDGMDTTIFTFDIVQAVIPPAPIISVSDGLVTLTPGQAAGGARDFGSLDTMQTSAALTITISNNGNADLTVSNFTVTGDSLDFITGFGSVSSPVVQSGSTSFTIEFNPQTAGQKVATIGFDHNDGQVTNPFTFDVTGVGTIPAPILEVRENNSTGAPITPGAAAAGIRAFGDHDIEAGATAPITIFVKNAGTDVLTLGVPTSNDTDFIVDATGFPPSLTPGTSATFTVSFNPFTLGAKTGMIEFTHNAATSNPFSFNVTGNGTTTQPTAGGGGGGGSGGGGCVAASNAYTYWLLVAVLGGLIALRRKRAVRA